MAIKKNQIKKENSPKESEDQIKQDVEIIENKDEKKETVEDVIIDPVTHTPKYETAQRWQEAEQEKGNL